MGEIILAGIKADIPIGAMAAFGLFRIMNCIRPSGETRLNWLRQGSSWRPVLSGEQEVSEEGVIQDLKAYLQSHSDRLEFGWRREIKSTTAEQFAEAARPAITEAQGADHELADWFSAFTNELITTEEETLEPTPFDMTVAQQRFLADSNSLRPNSRVIGMRPRLCGRPCSDLGNTGMSSIRWAGTLRRFYWAHSRSRNRRR
jgi:hypothetical protein